MTEKDASKRSCGVCEKQVHDTAGMGRKFLWSDETKIELFVEIQSTTSRVIVRSFKDNFWSDIYLIDKSTKFGMEVAYDKTNNFH